MQSRKKILAVDDNVNNNAIVGEILGELYDVKFATTGQEALRVAVDFQPDLILLDVMMPGMDGYEVCRSVCNNPLLKDTVVVMVSARNSVDDKYKGYEVGSYDYITKPFTEDDLKDSIEYFLKTNCAAEGCS